ncbi:MAG: esterase/lipase [Arenicella sp.]|jgi:esterase/lipase
MIVASLPKSPVLLLLLSFFCTVNAFAFDLESIDQRLNKSEARYSDIVDGTQKTIVWFAQPARPTAISIVYLHGFSASHKELSPMTEQLAEKLQANVFYSRLTGHGRSGDALAEATTEAWKKDAQEAYEIGATIGEQVLLIGTSTGGTLSTWLSAQPFADRLLGNVLISPNFAIKSGGAWLLKNPLGLWLAKQLSGDYRSFEPLNDFHAMYWTERYPLDALVPMLELLDEVDELDKSNITTPQLLVYSPNDRVIDVEKALATAKQFTSASVTLVPFTTSTDPSQHVLVGQGSTAGDEVQQQVDKMLKILLPYVEQLIDNSSSSAALSLPKP